MFIDHSDSRLLSSNKLLRCKVVIVNRNGDQEADAVSKIKAEPDTDMGT